MKSYKFSYPPPLAPPCFYFFSETTVYLRACLSLIKQTRSVPFRIPTPSQTHQSKRNVHTVPHHRASSSGMNTTKPTCFHLQPCHQTHKYICIYIYTHKHTPVTHKAKGHVHAHTHTRSPLKQTCYYECAESSSLLFPPRMFTAGITRRVWLSGSFTARAGKPGQTHTCAVTEHTHTHIHKRERAPKVNTGTKKSNEIKPFVPLYYCQCETAVVTCLCKNMDLIIPMHGYHKRYKSIKSSVLHSYTQCFFTTIFFSQFVAHPPHFHSALGSFKL